MQVSLPSWCRIVRDVDAQQAVAFHERPAITGPADAARYLGARLCHEEVEVFAVLLLDAQARVIALQEVTRGLVNSSLVHPREVFRLAIAMNATAVILGHNHPSGVLRPSPEDHRATEALVAAGAILDIPVQDHLILGLTDRDYYSFASNHQL